MTKVKKLKVQIKRVSRKAVKAIRKHKVAIIVVVVVVFVSAIGTVGAGYGFYSGELVKETTEYKSSKSELATAEKNLMDLEAKYDNTQTELVTKKEDKSKLESAQKDLQAEIDKIDKEIAGLPGQIDKKKMEVHLARTKYYDYYVGEMIVARGPEGINLYIGNYPWLTDPNLPNWTKQAKADYDKKQAEYDALLKAKNTKDVQKSEVQQKMADNSVKIEKLTKEIASLEKESTGQSDGIASKNSDIDRLKKDVKRHTHWSQKLQDKLKR